MNTENLNVAGSRQPKIIIAVDPPPKEIYDTGKTMSKNDASFFAATLSEVGISPKEVALITCAAPVPEEIAHAPSKVTAYVDGFSDEFTAAVSSLINPSTVAVVAMGKNALRACHGGAVKISKVRGTVLYKSKFDLPLYPTYSAAHVSLRPELKDVFTMDWRRFAEHIQNGFTKESKQEGEYHLCYDLTEWINDPPKVMAVDTETTGGLKWYKGTKILCVSLARNEDEGIVIPFDCDYYTDLTPEHKEVLRGQLRQLLGNKSIKVVGANFKYDMHAFANEGIHVANWWADTQQLAFAVDENMERKGLKECVRRWVPEMANYSESFDEEYDKGKIHEAGVEALTEYAGADARATFILAKRLVALCMKDKRQWRCFRRIQMPALNTFFWMERVGVKIDPNALLDFRKILDAKEVELRDSILAKVPAEVKRMHLEAGLALSRDAFVRDILFSKQGLKLTPKVFTKGSTKDEMVPSISAKDHLVYFAEHPIVQELIEYSAVCQMRSTYVGNPESTQYIKCGLTKKGRIAPSVAEAFKEKGIILDAKEADAPTFPLKHDITNKGKRMVVDANGCVFKAKPEPAKGFWQHLSDQNTIHCSFGLSFAVTGRANCREPNLQNISKRNSLAKPFRKAFVAREGYSYVSADLSQAELRFIAAMAREENMLEIYRQGGDIHLYTGTKVVAGIEYERALQHVKDQTPLLDVVNEWNGADSYLSKMFGQDTKKKATLASYIKYLRQSAKSISFGYCLAEGQRVLTNDGLVPIENITLDHKVWDGENWVEHEGLIYQGEREVMYWDGVVATEDHVVYTEVGPKTMLEAAYCGLRIVNTAREDGSPLRLEQAQYSHWRRYTAYSLGIKKTYDLLNAGPNHRFTCEGRLVSNCYGMGWRKFKLYAKTQYGLDYTDEEAEKLRKGFFRLYPRLESWHEAMKSFARKHEYVRAMHGALRRLPSIKSSDEGIRRECERQAINSSIQRISSDMGLIAMSRFAEGADREIMRPLLFIHDDVTIECRDEYVRDGAAYLRWCMQNPPFDWFDMEMPIPMLSDLQIGKTLGSMEEVTDIEPVKPPWIE